MTTQPTTEQARQFISRASRVARRHLRRVATQSRERAGASRRSTANTGSTATNRAARPATARVASTATLGAPRLAPSTALRENGFTVYRGLFSASECAELALKLKSEACIQDRVRFTKVDATNSFPTARELVLEGRILDAVRSALGEQPHFLQVSDLHYLHDTSNWHRDSVHRAQDSSEAPDWRDAENPYGVVKAILYLESDNAGMGIMSGSHLSPIEMDRARVKSIEEADGQIVIDGDDDPNVRLPAQWRGTPLAWHARVGDVLVFDERMYHAGRRVENGHVSRNREASKFTLSLVFGRDNHHSERLYSYFRFARSELHYRDLVPSFAAELAQRDLVLGCGWNNFYLEEPAELRHVYLPDPSRLEPLIREFSGVQPAGGASDASSFI